jgi:hypothetical protein
MISARASTLPFCSLTDARFLPQLIVMHRSLRHVLPEAETEVLCMDTRAVHALERLAIQGLVPIAIEELEQRDPGLAAARVGRSSHEYCQTAKPAFCLDALTRHGTARWVTYVDSDTMFFSDPRPLFDELGEASIGLLGNRLAPRFRGRERWASPYCPSWVSFANDSRGTEAARWWRSRCLEWCFHRVEGGRYSDQGYLRDWPQRFAGVHVLQHPGLGPAPWTRNDGLARDGEAVTIDGRPLILFHYQSLRLQRARGTIGRGRRVPGAPIPLFWRVYRGYSISDRERELVWEPYLQRLAEAIGELHSIDPQLVDELQPPGLREVGRGLVRHAWMRKHDLAAALERRLGRVAEDGGAATG